MDEASNREAIAAAGAHQEVFACVGRHPNAATGFDRASGGRDRGAGRRASAWWRSARPASTTTATAPRGAEQRAAFEAQIAIGRRTGLPLVIHMRDPAGGDEALSDTFATLAAEAEGVTVVLHCCSAPPERVGEAAERGWYCSFAGNVTYPKADGLREAARLVPEELLLVETDSPFLAPQSVRGKPNQPANVVEVAERLAAERGIGYEVLERIVEANAAQGFQMVRLGQNFLADTNLLEAIVRDADLDPGDVALEIGAGEGALSDRIAPPGRPPARDRARPAAGRRPGGGVRPPPESLGRVGRRDADRSAGAGAGADRGGLEPPLLDRHPGPAEDGRRAARGRGVDGDGAARDRRPAAGEPRLANLRGAQRAGPARLRGRAAAGGGSRRVSAAAAGGFGPPAAHAASRGSAAGRWPGSCATRSRIAASRWRDRSSWPGGRRGRRCAGRSARSASTGKLGPRRSRPPTSSSSRSAWGSIDAPRAREAQPLPLPGPPPWRGPARDSLAVLPADARRPDRGLGRRRGPGGLPRRRGAEPGRRGADGASRPWLEALAGEGGDREAHSRGGRAGRRQRRRRGAPAPGA